MFEKYTQDELMAFADRLVEEGFDGWKPKDWAAMTRLLASVLDERDALRTELATVKAALPKWRKFGHGHRLMSESIAIADVWQSGAYWMSDVFAGHNPKCTNKTREAAMTAVTEALGLPPCEVCE